MLPTQTYQSRFSKTLAAVTVALCAVLLVSLALTGDPSATLRYAGPVALVGFAAWAAYWRPRIGVSDGGVEVRNVWRTVNVAWPAVQEIDTRFGLRLVTAYGAYQAWAVPPPRRETRRAGRPIEPSEGAAMVTCRWEALRAAGHLENPHLEAPRARTTLHLLTLVTLAGLLAASVAVVLLAP